ncbi:E3 ubiquitin-protein ligase PUB22 [Hibiscus syriacus]|uniref:U-box domain-containing protein n=1 Tax=Hibiscus syriacus TaxID=106335 RepID=A0A6A3D894_HIBSY|nr:E3 ubiquitin-protein ligase PUB23-like [Hibiscus syriacus]KAE8735581.1 E3 ubiquitin-protein ligase PUB22 [Hibiscus syriacus]
MDEIEIPCHFLCPISLQLMRDPVAISTGITYDRESIEQWLFSCKKKVCPVTKQPLHGDSELTPNHTLRRLIQAWCTLNASHGIERIPTPKPPINKTQIARLIKDANKFPETQVKCLETLISITLEGERNRGCLETTGSVEFLVSIIKSYDSSSSQVIKAGDEALSILYHIKVSESCLKSIVDNDNQFVESLVQIVKNGSYQSRAYATILLNDVSQVADPIHLINPTPEFLAEIVRTLRDQISQQATKEALKLLAELCPWGRNRIKAVEGGAVFVLVMLLIESSTKRVSELAFIVLDQLCNCAEGRAELLDHGAGLAMVSKKILRVSHAASKRAVRILSPICRFSATSRVLQEMLKVGVVEKLCVVLQIDNGYETKGKAREILKLHARVWRNHSCIPSYLLSYPSS